MDDVSMGFALSAPHARQPTSYSPPKEPFVESLTDFGEKLAVGIIKRDRTRPVNRRVGDQGMIDHTRIINCFNYVCGLV